MSDDIHSIATSLHEIKAALIPIMLLLGLIAGAQIGKLWK